MVNENHCPEQGFVTSLRFEKAKDARNSKRKDGAKWR